MSAAIAAAAVALVLAGCPSEITPNIGWTAEANNSDSTTAIIFTFNAPVTEARLSGNVSVAVQGGEVVVGNITGGGRLWTLPITVINGGTAWVSINASGISDRPVAFDVTPSADEADITWRAQDSALQIVFENYSVENLTEGQIRISPDDGEAVTSGAPRRINAQTWLVPISVIRTGFVMVSIDRAGVGFKETPVNLYLISPNISFDATESAIRIDFFDYDADQEYNLNLTRDQVVTQAITANVTFADTLRRAEDGLAWLLPATVTREGTVLVWIDRPGVTTSGEGSAANPVVLGNVAPIQFTVLSYAPVTDTETSQTTRIYITFTAPIPSLALGNLSIRSVAALATGVPSIPSTAQITGSGRRWSVDISVPPTGNPNQARLVVTVPGVATYPGESTLYNDFSHEFSFTRAAQQ